MAIIDSKFTEQERYDLAKRRVKKIQGFYVHLTVYIVINLMILVLKTRHLGEDESFFQWEIFSTLIFWGIGLLVHGCTVFLPNFILGKNWEERKIKQLMEQERNNI